MVAVDQSWCSTTMMIMMIMMMMMMMVVVVMADTYASHVVRT